MLSHFPIFQPQFIILCSVKLKDIASNEIYRFNSSNGVRCIGNDSSTLISLSTNQLPLRSRFIASINITNCVNSTSSDIILSK